MSRLHKRTPLALALTGWLALSLSSPVVAAEPVSLTPRQYEQLNRLTQALQEEQGETLVQLGNRLLEQPSGQEAQQAFLRAYAARILAQWYQQQGETTLGLSALEQALSHASLLDAETRQATRWFALQLHLELGQYAQALGHLEDWWQEEEQPSAEAYYLRAALLAQVERWVEAQPDIVHALGVQERPSWLTLAVVIFQRNEDWAAAAYWQQKRVELSPEQSELWLQLVQLQRLAGAERQALVTLELAQRQGHLSAAQQEELARRLLVDQQALRAAQVLERMLEQTGSLEVDVLRLTAQAWMQTRAHEPTAIALQRLAAHSSARRDQQLAGDWMFRQGRWQEAIALWQPLVDQLEPRAAARLQLLIAHALVEQEDYAAARRLLQELMATSEEEQARQWLNYLNALDV